MDTKEDQPQSRRQWLAASLVAPMGMAQASTGGANAVTEGRKTLRLMSAWPSTSTGFAALLGRASRKIAEMSGGSLQIEVVYADQTKKSALQIYDAVASGEFDLSHATPYYWTGRSAAFNFFSTVPFGMLPVEHYSWLRYGGGHELWKQLCAPTGVVPLPCGNSGVQMGGWMRKPIDSLQSLKGLKLRYPGLGGEVLRALGATPVTLPAIEIISALRDGRIDGAEWVSPWPDLDMGLHQVCNYYYAPGFHEPGHTAEMLVNQRVWEKLSSAHKAILETYGWGEFMEMQAHFYHENARSLDRLRSIKTLQVLRYPNDVVKAFRLKTPEVVRAAVETDPFAKTVHDSYYGYLRQQLRWAELSDRAYWQARYI